MIWALYSVVGHTIMFIGAVIAVFALAQGDVLAALAAGAGMAAGALVVRQAQEAAGGL